MKRFIARASRHVGFQIGAVLLLLFVGTALISIFWTPHAVDELQMRAKLMPSSALYPLGTDQPDGDRGLRPHHDAREHVRPYICLDRKSVV